MSNLLIFIDNNYEIVEKLLKKPHRFCNGQKKFKNLIIFNYNSKI